MSSKVIYSYVRENGRPFACIAAIGPDNIGISVCSPRDTFQKNLARKIAAGRAEKSANGIPISVSRNTERFKLVEQAVEQMKRRAAKYFK